MIRYFAALLALVLCMTTDVSIAYSDCLEDRHPVEFDEGKIIQFRTYTCTSGDVQLRVEFNRLADMPASLLVSGLTSDRLRDIIGSPHIIQNEVFATYANLLRQFGRTYEIKDSQISVSAEAGGAGGAGSVLDAVNARAIRTLTSPYGPGGGAYPAIEEYAAVRNKIIPSNMKYFYEVPCQDQPPDSDKPVCLNFDRNSVQMNFWRSMRADDVAMYAQRMRIFNARFMPPGTVSETRLPLELQLLSHLAGENWPPNFSIVIGNTLDGCDSGFSFVVPTIMLEVALIENTSSHEVTVDDLFGGVSSETRLRLATSSALTRLATSGNILNGVVGVLAPGEKVLLPVRIIVRPNQYTVDKFGYRQTAAMLHRQMGTNGFGGNTGAFGAPEFATYVYGREIGLGGFSANGSRFDLANRSANFMEMTMSLEAGSCPYLLSRGEDETEWIDQGKVLHGASTRSREYTERRVFPGFKGHFRLEEREPEIAHIDRVELVILLSDGQTIRLRPQNENAGMLDSGSLRLFWGDSAQMEFELPRSVMKLDVQESRLEVTGYYLRYADLIARLKPSRALKVVAGRSLRASGSAIANAPDALNVVIGVSR